LCIPEDKVNVVLGIFNFGSNALFKNNNSNMDHLNMSSFDECYLSIQMIEVFIIPRNPFLSKLSENDNTQKTIIKLWFLILGLKNILTYKVLCT
jgi:hypothetical protein